MSEIYVCFEWEPTQRHHYHATGEWIIAGIVENKEDAKIWVEPDGDEERRKYETWSLNHVEAFYTENLQ